MEKLLKQLEQLPPTAGTFDELVATLQTEVGHVRPPGVRRRTRPDAVCSSRSLRHRDSG
ncbi:hypothetical protein [Streptomyces sp. NPDC050982]|uniref:hypothetical protein n=1 Tax=Streptomyces sp. NPDC050982 TaxID=3154746 RepID=UPI0033D017E2